MANNLYKVPFDPGYAKHISSFMYFNEQVKVSLMSLKTPQQRAFRYRQLLPQIISVMEKEVGFYYGCLLWAAYISYENPPKEISDNSFYGRTKADLEKYDYLQEVNYLLSFFEQYPKDLSYYKISAPQIERKITDTAKIYKEFLRLNESFINVRKTSDLKLPDGIKSFDNKELKNIKSLIDKTVADGNFDILFSVKLFN